MAREILVRWSVAVVWGLVGGFAAVARAQDAPPRPVICTPEGASPLETLAAREIRRYLYLRTGGLVAVTETGATLPDAAGWIVVATNDRPLALAAAGDDATVRQRLAALGAEHYLLKTLDRGGRRCVLVVGSDPVATLYAAYRFAEQLGVRFFLHGDEVPDQRMPLELPMLDEPGRPLFALRGIQPFHDFPEGPDWWELDDYKAVIAQLPKLRLNFLGLHTYPEPIAEPAVWIGVPEDIDTAGRVKFGYPASWHNTLRGDWGYAPGRTGTFHFGAAQLFPRDDFGGEVMAGFTPKPDGNEECTEVFRRAGLLLREAFTFARRLGVKTCVGTETPLTVPRRVALRLHGFEPPVQALGGQAAAFPAAVIADTDDDVLYQTVRYDLDGYRLSVPDGKYTVVLKFCEPHYREAGKRVFGVTLQKKTVIERLDVYEQVGQNRAIDYTFDDVAISGGVLEIGFVRQVEFPCIAAIAVTGPEFALKVNCGGPAYKDYEADDGGLRLPPEQIRRLYAGIFRRITETYPIDYYWLWTPEGWTWSGASDAQVTATVDDLELAIAAAKAVKAPFTLATCGWVLGPPQDRALFDRKLPPEMPVSCISRQVGQEPVEPGFATVQGRPKWSIPWLEDDPALTAAQLWAGRMRRDAADSLAYGCTGLMGIHWRTRAVAPNILALAWAAWDQQGWTASAPAGSAPAAARFAPTGDFYRDFAGHLFGPQIAADAAMIFERIDGRLPRPADWVDGPGGLKPDPRPWAAVAPDYAFVDELAALRPRVPGPADRARLDGWLAYFRQLRAMGRVNCATAVFNAAMAEVRAAKDPDAQHHLALEKALPARRDLVDAVREAYRHLLQTIQSPGELGTVMNFELHLLPRLLGAPGEELARFLGRPLPAEAVAGVDYDGPPRVIVPTVRSSVAPGETLALRVLVLAPRPPLDAALYWRPMGRGEFVKVGLHREARGVYRAVFPPDGAQEDLEYYVQATFDGGRVVRTPAGAPALAQTVVVAPE